MNLMEVNKVCSHCKEVREVVTDGDLIMRYDWEDADDAPWQLQSSFVDEADYLCTDCYAELVNLQEDWKKLCVMCSKCDGVMRVRGALG